MSKNNELLRDAAALIEEFSKGKEVEQLRLAYLKLEGVSIYEEANVASRYKARVTASGLWIKILNLIDENLSPDFDPDKTVAMSIMPPMTKQGVQFPPGVEPLRLTDAEDRKKYELAIAENKKAQQRYKLELQLSQINNQIKESSRDYFVLAYQSTDADQQEFKMLINAEVKSTARKKSLLELVR